MAKINKTKTTNPPVVFEVYSVEGLTKTSIDMYILHDSSLVVCSSVKEASAMLSYSPVPREMAGSVTF